MLFRTLLCLALTPLLAASIAARFGVQLSSPALSASVGANQVPDVADAIRPVALVVTPSAVRSSSHQGKGGTGSLRSGARTHRFGSSDCECTPVRLATWKRSHAAAAHGGPLIYFPTAPPVHG